MAAVMPNKSFVRAQSVRSTRRGHLAVVASGAGKVDPKSVPVQTVGDTVVRNNLIGVSRYMTDKNWVDPSGRKGKGLGVYRFANKYGVNVDGYQPIYSPDTWGATGNEYKLGTKGLLAWAGLLLVGLAVSINLIISTSQISL